MAAISFHILAVLQSAAAVKTFYSEDLAFVHHSGFQEVALSGAAAALRLLSAPSQILDLGCAGGLWAKQALEAGHRVVGYDISEPMIEIAREHAPQAEFHARSFVGAEWPRTNLITAFGEIFNYVAAGPKGHDGLDEIFHQAAASLDVGGHLYFDMIVRDVKAPMQYRSWKSADTWSILVEVKELPAEHALERNIILFRDPGSGYRRSEETHRIGIPEAGDVIKKLNAAGFECETSKSYGAVPLAERRLAFLAYRV